VSSQKARAIEDAIVLESGLGDEFWEVIDDSVVAFNGGEG
jgi:hypothetical protein